MPGQPGDRIRAFVGRTGERAALGSGLDAAIGGRGTLCLIGGEPGIGKSRLLTEFVAEHASRCPSIHWGFAWEAGGAPVYWPWIQILRSLLTREPVRGLLRDSPRLAAPLGDLVPEMSPAADGAGARLEPEQARFRLMDSITSLLVAAAAQEPLVLILEDLHAVDTDSLSLLEFAIRQLHGSRVLIIGTFRDAEINRPRIGNIVARLRRAAIQLPLRRLDRDEVREYVRSATHERPLEQDVTELATLTEGHPLYLAEVVELGWQRGNLRDLPSSIRLVILERAAHLPAQTRSLLGMASVLGRGFKPAALAEIAALDEAAVRESLAAAVASGLLEQDSGGLRFEHMLVREAFHDALPPIERRRLHEREAQRMRSKADRGATISWAALAQHCEESGEGAVAEAVEAWRNAARQAESRHSFDDAALCFNRALMILGEASSMGAQRARLLLELATAQIRAGDLDAGRRNSFEAFNIGETLGDADLLADAALTYGGIFTFGSVDPRLVGLLKTALASVVAGDTDRRARLQARLAAAMQPAADPSEPVLLAQQAIALARSSGNARTLLTTLRSAVSALMDLGDPRERLALNQEYVRLARQLGDAPECMRGYLRSSVDAMELGDAATLDDSIDQCDVLADQLAMPHYQWTAAAMRVMRATFRGDFALADEALARARRMADRAQDSNAALTLLVQELALAEMKDDLPQLEALIARLERQSSGMPHADKYLRPALLAAASRLLGRELKPEDIDEEALRGIIRFCDMGALASLGDCLTAMGNRALLELAYDSTLPYRERCGHWGMLGLRWFGPMERSLGVLAFALGRTEAANRHFAAAVEVAQRMRARPWFARIVLEWIEHSRRAGDVSPRALDLVEAARSTAGELGLACLAERLARCLDITASPPAATVPLPASAGIPAVSYFRLVADGEIWVCECNGRSFRLRDSRGVQMLARLIVAPGHDVHVLDLMGAAAAEQGVDSGDSGDALDQRGRQEYRRRLESLRAELEEAESLNDLASAEAAREEIEQLSAELARAFGLGGRARRIGSNVERARVNVQRRLKHAIERIGSECPEAGKHLEWAVRTGVFCSYRPN